MIEETDILIEEDEERVKIIKSMLKKRKLIIIAETRYFRSSTKKIKQGIKNGKK